MKSIQDIDHVYYINLDTRPDRKTHVESQLDSIGIKQYTRYSACMMVNGAIGCTMSHLKLLEIKYNPIPGSNLSGHHQRKS